MQDSKDVSLESHITPNCHSERSEESNKEITNVNSRHSERNEESHQEMTSAESKVDSNKEIATNSLSQISQVMNMESKEAQSKIDSLIKLADNTQSTTDSTESTNAQSTAQNTESNNKKAYKLNAINAISDTQNIEQKKYQSGSFINQRIINDNPSGNGDITSLLRILPNVQYDNAQLKSTTPGEIDPANISISGGLFYQNNFQLDGFNMNNDLDPNGGDTNNQSNIRGGRSQGFAVDTSLLESINVQDSNISAAYGRFTGGVVEANIKKPSRDGWHARASYQYTSDIFTQYFIHSDAETLFLTSADENYQPHFTKHLFKSNLQGYITKNFGLTAAFSTTQSIIPLQNYRSNYSNVGNDVTEQRDQHRSSFNYYLKANYNPLESLYIEANIGYMPQDNTYFNSTARNSFYRMKSGGVQSGIKVLWDTNIGTWNNTLGYSYMTNSRDSDADYFYQWRRSEEKNWGGTSTIVFEGGYGNMEQAQHTLNYKSEMQFASLDWWRMSNNFKAGFELSYQYVARNRLNDLTVVQGNPTLLTGNQTCGTDSFGLDLCSMSPVIGNTANVGQYANTIRIWRAGKANFDLFSYGIYLEDDIKFDFGFMGEINARLGVRLDGDNYMSKHTFAPRFSLNYTAPWNDNYKTTLIFGANRYYGRSLLSYMLYAIATTNRDEYTRTIDSTTNTPGAWQLATQTNVLSGYMFSKLNVPYDDEIMVGLTQNLWYFNIALKYIHREGKDEIMQRQINSTNTWSNDGRSSSNIITLSIQNNKTLEFLGIKNYIMFAFDYTQTNRSYNIYSEDTAYIENDDIIYNGQLIKYRDRPVENWARPYTLRLTTTHTFTIWRTKWLWNNFFRYRAGYERMVLLNRTNAGYDPNFSQYSQYGRMAFKGAFTWDMRIGFEIDVYKKNTLFVNLDIYNVLNTQNMTTLQASGIVGTAVNGIASASAIPVYEIGRQFWLEVGYRF